MNTILLGNLIKIRWIAIFGQFLAIFFVSFVIKIQIPFFETLSIILLSVVVNIYSYYEERKNKSISNTKAFSYLLFDTLQLGFLLFLTGGIINPFSILILAPVITSASYNDNNTFNNIYFYNYNFKFFFCSIKFRSKILFTRFI